MVEHRIGSPRPHPEGPPLGSRGHQAEVTLLGYTAIAGAVGAGGLGDLAIRYGYQRSVPSMMLATVVLIIVLVQIIQSLFSWLSTKMDKRLR